LKAQRESVIVTGVAGFIGFHLTSALIRAGYRVYGIDNINDYYSVQLKQDRLKYLSTQFGIDFVFHQFDLENYEKIQKLQSQVQAKIFVHLAAQAGVRYSLSNPQAYLDSNLQGFLNILETARHSGVKNFIYASSSSVYGANRKLPFSEMDNVDHPISLYAASKKANELMAHSYSHLYDLPTTGLRFFTVYGPWGRPDMAMFLFADAIRTSRPLKLFGNGDLKRDFTYVDDIVESIVRLCEKPAISNNNWDGLKSDPSTSSAPYQLFNIGNNSPVVVKDVVKIIEECMGKKAIIEHHPMQPGDVKETSADTRLLESYIGFKPKTSIESGIEKFISWFKEYHNI
jgi:UDP-glucuronate 4-epimerase